MAGGLTGRCESALWGTTPDKAVAREKKKRNKETMPRGLWPENPSHHGTLMRIHTHTWYVLTAPMPAIIIVIDVTAGQFREAGRDLNDPYYHSLFSSALTLGCMMTTSSASASKEGARVASQPTSFYNYFYFLKQLKI